MEDVVSKNQDMPLFFLLPPFSSSVSALCSGGKKGFQEQPSLSKLALKSYWTLETLWYTVSVHLCIQRWGYKAKATMCHTVSYLKKMHMRNDRQMSHSVNSY